MSHKIITCTGYGNTGSSAGTNFFEEFSNILSVGSSGFECLFLHETDGVIDLFKAVTEGNRLKTDLAIKRFIKLINTLNYANPAGPSYKDFFNGHFLEYTKQYLKDLNILQWNGWWHRVYDTDFFDFNDFIAKQALYQKKIKKSSYSLYEPDTWKPNFSLRTTMYYCSISEKEFFEITKKYLAKLFDECDPENKYEYLLFDQLLPSNCNDLYLNLFNDIKVLVIDRDPRDLYFANKVFWNSGYIPSNNIELFIDWYKKTRSLKCQNKNIFYLNFESIIFEYEKTTDSLISFIGLDPNKWIKKGCILQPQFSQQNTRLWLQYNIINQPVIYDYIKQIEEKLCDYCYNFPQNSIINIEQKDHPYLSEEIDFELNSLNLNVIKKICTAAFYFTKLRQNITKTKHKKISTLLAIIVFPLDYLLQIIKSTFRELKYFLKKL